MNKICLTLEDVLEILERPDSKFHKYGEDVYEVLKELLKYGLFSASSIPYMPTRIVHNGPSTTVFWDDDTKTVVKCAEDDLYSEYTAFTAAYVKKLFGNNSRIKRIIALASEEGN